MDRTAEIELARTAAPESAAVTDPSEHLAQFVIPTQRWSDGTENR
jgi:hypothetical protein